MHHVTFKLRNVSAEMMHYYIHKTFSTDFEALFVLQDGIDIDIIYEPTLPVLKTTVGMARRATVDGGDDIKVYLMWVIQI